ncbi:MAG: hypothetical protein JWR19_4146 [Pedosphaera sp.]|nr:hypothetical protein [Pedosphaera sp.]
MPRYSAKTAWPLVSWLLLCAFLSCVGWVLSALHQLNATGYAICFLLAAATLLLLRQRRILPALPPIRPRQFRRRFARPFPVAFLTLATLAFLGGLLHPPSNYDGLAYREPRVLHWLAEGHWHWIYTDFHRLNVRACGYEWVTAPLLVFTKTDRLLFLINIVSLLLLPGLVFSTFTRLGIQRRTAWYWMWLLPTGYCFLLQSGSIANDLFGAVFALAALDLALRARQSQNPGQFWLSCLAVALLTGSKASNLPFLLPWSIAIFPCLPILWRRWVPTLAVGVVAIGCSFLPVAAINIYYCGDWSGQAAEQAYFKKIQPLLHITHNATLSLLQNLTPPVWPLANAWNQTMLEKISPSIQRRLENIFEPSAAHLKMSEVQTEENSGLGFGISLLILATFAATLFLKRPAGSQLPPRSRRLLRVAILGAVWLSAVPFMSVSGASTAARYLTPYYALMVPIFFLNQSGDWTRSHKWWHRSAAVVFLLAGLLVIISPARPLWPARTILSKLHPESSPLVKRLLTVYTVYAARSDAFAPVREHLPDDASPLGLITFDDPETSLWRPFGHRRIVHVRGTDSAADLRQRGIQYVLVNTATLEERSGLTLDQWVEKNHLDIIQMVPLNLRASAGAVPWPLVRVPPAGTGSM